MQKSGNVPFVCKTKTWNPKWKKAVKNHPENPDEKIVQRLEAQTENVKNIFQRNSKSDHYADKGAASDPHDTAALQKI